MLRLRRAPRSGCLAVLLLALGVCPARAQINSNEQTALLTAVLPETLAVVLAPPATTFVLTGGSATNAGVLTLTATTTYALSLTRTSLSLYGYFADASSALAHVFVTNTSDIPAARVEASVNGGGLVAFDQTVPFGAASAGRQLWTQAVTPATAAGIRIDTIALNINLASYPLPADTYIGTLRIRAQGAP